MTWTQTLHTAWSAVRSHGLRSTLTILGILIGIAAVILTVGLGLGSQKDVSARINSLGSNLLIVTPGSTTSATGIRGGFGSNTTLKRSDAVALTSKQDAPDIAAVAPEKSTQLSLVNGTTNWTTTVTGTTASWLGVRARQLSAGQFVTDAQDAARADVVVLGADTATQLYGTTNAVGRTVTMNNVEFTVIGVLSKAGSSSSTSLDDMAVVPLSTAAEQLVGGSTRDAVNRIYIEAASAGQLSGASQEATQLLLNLHSITSASNADFTVSSQESLVSTATAVARTLTVLLTGIAALSLLVGGIGVMNIMLVSVTERTREIGIRLAIGAHGADVLAQFLIEAILLSVLGGVLGILCGVGASQIITIYFGLPTLVSPLSIVVAVGVSTAIGVFFGFYPARKAAQLDPIDALRYE